jgi:hypothetical protein
VIGGPVTVTAPGHRWDLWALQTLPVTGHGGVSADLGEQEHERLGPNFI